MWSLEERGPYQCNARNPTSLDLDETQERCPNRSKLDFGRTPQLRLHLTNSATSTTHYKSRYPGCATLRFLWKGCYLWLALLNLCRGHWCSLSRPLAAPKELLTALSSQAWSANARSCEKSTAPLGIPHRLWHMFNIDSAQLRTALYIYIPGLYCAYTYPGRQGIPNIAQKLPIVKLAVCKNLNYLQTAIIKDRNRKSAIL